MTFAPRSLDEWVPVAAVFGNLAEFLTLLGALAAVAISIWAFAISKRSERRQQFIRLHEIMISQETQKGRRLLWTHAENPKQLTRLNKRDPETFDQINRAVSLYHTLAIYARRGYLPLDVVLDQWGANFERFWPRIHVFMLWRLKNYEDAALWEDMVWFADVCERDVDASLRQPSRRKTTR